MVLETELPVCLCFQAHGTGLARLHPSSIQIEQGPSNIQIEPGHVSMELMFRAGQPGNHGVAAAIQLSEDLAGLNKRHALDGGPRGP